MRSRVWWSVGICQLLIHYWNMYISYFVQKYQTCQQLRFFDLIQHLFTLYYHKFTISRSVISQHWFLSLPGLPQGSNSGPAILMDLFSLCQLLHLLSFKHNLFNTKRFLFFLGLLIHPMKKIKLCKIFKKKNYQRLQLLKSSTKYIIRIIAKLL